MGQRFLQQISRKEWIHIWKTYEQETGEICKRTKGKGDRWLGMAEPLKRALVEYKLQARPKKTSQLLICQSNGNPFDEYVMRRRHKKVCKKAGVKTIRIHDLRHTYASHYVMKGGTLPDLQSLLGHASSEMTQKYSHLTPGHLESNAHEAQPSPFL